MVIKLTLTIEDIDVEIAEFNLTTSDNIDNNLAIWEKDDQAPTGPDYALSLETQIINEALKKIEITKKGSKILSTDDEIQELFFTAFLEASFEKQIDHADGIEHEHSSANSSSVIVDKDPYDPKLIRVDTKPFSIHQVIEMIQSNDIDLSPDFQREFVWLDITRKSRLIESLLLRIPLPVFYLAQDEDGRFRVVDGVQRLTVIRDFVENKFKLKNLEYLSECEGKWYKNESRPQTDSLEQIYVRRIDQTQLFFNIIDPQTPEKVKYDIFRRINTGGKSLNRQEIRNCLERPATRTFIKQLAQSDEFITATKHSISSTRMADNEIVLRFVAFYLLDHNLYGQISYKGDMDAYLDHTVELLNKLSSNHFDKIEIAFKNAMKNAHLLFGDSAFRKANYINKSLFLSWTRVLCDVSNNKLIELKIGDKLLNRLKTEIEKNIEYSKALSMATNDLRNVELTYCIAKKLLKELGINA